MNECELEAILTHTYRRRGSARHAFAPIVASGPNATVLHYERNTRTIEPGELVLVDSGCELDYCAADVTRTFPVDGRFDERQRRIYEIVLAAELAAIAEVKPEATLDDVHKKACEVIVDGLLGLGLLAGERDDIVEKGSFKRFYPHRTSHWLGMDVHDAGRYFVDGKPRPLGPGMVLTVEPGLYIPPSGDHAPPELRGIGVRIEDDVLVTEDGCEVLTASIPKAIDEIEACCPR
jgi:Xaa-Pro aminopeptidase